MHIVHVYKAYYPVWGGIENHIRHLAEAQVKRGHEVTVLVTHPSRATLTEMINGVRVIRAASLGTLASTPLSPALPRLLRDLRPDLTHLQSPYPVGEVAQWLMGRARPYVISYQAEVNRPAQKIIMGIYGPLYRRILRGARAVIATSPNFAAHSANLNAVRERVTIVPLGTDPERFTPAAEARAPQPLTILFVGQLRHYKGGDDLIRALARLTPEARLIIAGNGPLRSAWETLAQTLGVSERVKFLGNVSDEALPALYRSADVFALPSTSRAESFGMVLTEAMASGVPCVTTEIGSGNSYVVEDGVTGLVVPPHAPEALAQALQNLLGEAALRARMGAAGRARVLQLFTVEKMLEGMERVYQRALQG